MNYNFIKLIGGWYNPPVGIMAPPEPRRLGTRPRYMLFDLKTDPSERLDIKNEPTKQPILLTMISKLMAYRQQMMPSEDSMSVRASKPASWGGAWSPGWC